MKKHIIFGLLALSVFAPVVAFAQQDVDPNPNTGSCASLSNNLRYQSRDAATSGEVSELQDFLQSENYLNSDPTGYFGLLTLQAVRDFQRANGISGTGYVGPITRAKLSFLTCGSSSAPKDSGTTPTVILKCNDATTFCTINPNTSAKLSWDSTNADECKLYVNNKDIGYNQDTGYTGTKQINVQTGPVSITTSYHVNCSNSVGNALTSAVTVIVPTTTLNPVSVTLSANPTIIAPGQSTTISWTAENATNCILDYTSSPRPINEISEALGTIYHTRSGSITFSPTSTTNYTMNCYNISSGQSQTKDLKVTVNSATSSYQVPIISSLSTSSANFGDTVYIHGAGFSEAPTVFTYSTVDGSLSPMNTTYISSNLLSVLVVQNVNGVNVGTGVHSLKVKNTDSSWSNSVTLSFTNNQTPSVPSCSAIHYNCSSGTAINGSESSSAWSWLCRGPGPAGSNDVSCSEAKSASAPTATLKCNGNTGSCTIPINTSANLSWTSNNTNSCSLFVTNASAGVNNVFTGWTGVSQTRVPTGDTTSSPVIYRLDCIGANNAMVTSAVTVNVSTAAATATIYVNGLKAPAPVSSGSPVAVAWTSTNTTSCIVYRGDATNQGPPIWSGTNDSYTATNITSYTRFRIVCTGGDASDQASVDVNPVASATASVTINHSHTPAAVNSGASVEVEWNSSNTTSCTIYRGTPSSNGSVFWTGGSGGYQTMASNITSLTTFRISCTGGTASDQASVDVISTTPPPAPTVRLWIDPKGINDGDSSTIYWEVHNATSCTANSSNFSNWLTGSAKSATDGTHTQDTGPLGSGGGGEYGISCTNSVGSASSKDSIDVP